MIMLNTPGNKSNHSASTDTGYRSFLLVPAYCLLPDDDDRTGSCPWPIKQMYVSRLIVRLLRIF
jgi:hypothetical protein